eukprot:gene11504-biopygen3181
MKTLFFCNGYPSNCLNRVFATGIELESKLPICGPAASIPARFRSRTPVVGCGEIVGSSVVYYATRTTKKTETSCCGGSSLT